MFKIAYGAGHNKFTKNRIPDGETEWVLNDRVARYFEAAARSYPVELLRVDHETEPVDLKKRYSADQLAEQERLKRLLDG